MWLSPLGGIGEGATPSAAERALLDACAAGEPEALRSAMRQGAKPSAATRDALRSAAGSGSEVCVRMLVGAGWDPMDMGASREGSALMAAAQAGALGCVRALLPFSNANAQDSGRRRALEAALLAGQAQAARLIAPKTDLKSPEGAWLAWQAVASALRPGLCAALLEAGADPQARGFNGRGALTAALGAAGRQGIGEQGGERAREAREALRELCAACGPNERGPDGEDGALRRAAEIGDLAIVSLLLDEGAAPSLGDVDFALDNGRWALADEMLARGGFAASDLECAKHAKARLPKAAARLEALSIEACLGGAEPGGPAAPERPRGPRL